MAEQAVLHRDRLKQRGSWIYLRPDDARQHPDYGVFGWALLLLAALFVGPMILLWQDVEIVFGPYDRPENSWILLAVDGVLLMASWTACRLLGAERAPFFRWFYFTVVLGLCSLAVFVSLCLFEVREILPFGVPSSERGGFGGWADSVPPIVWWGIALRLIAIMLATVYVMQSSRLNVTVSKRVSPNDPFVSRAWSASTAPVATVPADVPGVSPSYPTAEAAPTPRAEPTLTPRATESAAARGETRTETRTEIRTEVRTETRDVPAAEQRAAPIVPDDRRLKARLRQLEDARAAGLISDAEYEARRTALLGANG